MDLIFFLFRCERLDVRFVCNGCAPARHLQSSSVYNHINGDAHIFHVVRSIHNAYTVRIGHVIGRSPFSCFLNGCLVHCTEGLMPLEIAMARKNNTI